MKRSPCPAARRGGPDDLRGVAALAGALLLVATAACGVDSPAAESDDVIASKVATALVTACPMAPPSDEEARARCSLMLSADKYLGAVMQEPFLWGGQKAGTSYHLEESSTNRFNVYVWRRMYLSLIMFTGEIRVERTADGLTVAHLPAYFRNELEAGSYPYPFWHSQKKWDSYQYAKEVLLVIQGGKWRGAMRTAEQDTSRPSVQHTWSGQWHWREGDAEMPYVSLYSYLLSAKNPHTSRLDSAYRALSDGLRAESCFMCHSPDNHANLTQLEFFNYPNQALYSRNSIIGDLQANVMPPARNDLGLPAGVADSDTRKALIALAREFKAAGDAALDFEGELKPNLYEPPGASIPP